MRNARSNQIRAGRLVGQRFIDPDATASGRTIATGVTASFAQVANVAITLQTRIHRVDSSSIALGRRILFREDEFLAS